MELPDDLRRLESELVGRPRTEPIPALRGRVLGAVRAELGRTVSRRTARRSFWRFAVSAAAAALLLANFGMATTRGPDCGLRRRPDAAGLAADARLIKDLLPEVTEREARRQALMLRAGPPPAPLPVPHGRPLRAGTSLMGKEG